MNILFTLCGRAGSKGVKNKNVRDFLGYPLSWYSLAVIRLFKQKHSGEFSYIDAALSTDSPELIAQAREACGEIFVIERDASLAGDMVRKIDVIRDAAKRGEAHFKRNYDIVVDLDITSPLRTLKDLEAVVEKRMNADKDVDVIYTVTEARRSPYFNMVKKSGKYYDRVLPSNFATRQEAPELYDMNASIYAYSRDFIYDTNWMFNRSNIVCMDDTGILDIDSDRDFLLIQAIAEYLYKNEEGHRQIRECVLSLKNNC